MRPIVCLTSILTLTISAAAACAADPLGGLNPLGGSNPPGAAAGAAGGLSGAAGLQNRVGVPIPGAGANVIGGPGFDVNAGVGVGAGGSVSTRGAGVGVSGSLDASTRLRARQRRTQPAGSRRPGGDPSQSQTDQSEPAAAGGGLSVSNSTVLRADLFLAHRLAEIDRLRDYAVSRGDTRLLARTDELEAQARAQHDHLIEIAQSSEDGGSRYDAAQELSGALQAQADARFAGSAASERAAWAREQARGLRAGAGGSVEAAAEWMNSADAPYPPQTGPGYSPYEADAALNGEGEAGTALFIPGQVFRAGAEGIGELRGAAAADYQHPPRGFNPAFELAPASAASTGQATGEAGPEDRRPAASGRFGSRTQGRANAAGRIPAVSGDLSGTASSQIGGTLQPSQGPVLAPAGANAAATGSAAASAVAGASNEPAPQAPADSASGSP